VDHWQGLAQALEAGEIELFVGEASEMDRDPALRVDLLAADQGVFFCRAGHPLAQRRRVTLEDVRAHPFVAPRIPPRILTWLFPGPGRSPQVIECESYAALRAAVEASDAVSGGFISVIADAVRERRLVALPVHVPEFVLHAGVVSLRRRTLSPAAESFAKIVLEVDRELSHRETQLLRD
jgi:DNA-binding transcriptional LysR family regulator